MFYFLFQFCLSCYSLYFRFLIKLFKNVQKTIQNNLNKIQCIVCLPVLNSVALYNKALSLPLIRKILFLYKNLFAVMQKKYGGKYVN